VADEGIAGRGCAQHRCDCQPIRASVRFRPPPPPQPAVGASLSLRGDRRLTAILHSTTPHPH
jgi:hypothetical protein